ncbi:zinc finger MIZ domain-containing protein 1 isoform X2 [Trypanosoma rangeli]|uniref:Zinc finger MIZ domain-containing protein 1 isoform X2 n=1 Tax=Trypanosoma rangeli TaxID=5698 RepID=A0A422NJS1_TRYRA|nr:zinc finger MIZ domain-containing protein 1 isoform X2 [Trypanosoma rangeli]RNF05723.1 zinc finger MIZ domain-containing protein 1 isoform X2 [Trypanosoma rangeli]|eukprot:RNF05723.1 zinc finger MIZ domain-containing protein 1 isoform X2 [Trypanosoma rangeli]
MTESDVDVDIGWVDDDGVDADNTQPGCGHTKLMKHDNNKTTLSSLPSGATIVADHGNDDGGLMDDGDAVVTLRCPLSYQRIRLAGKGKHCTHLACFDVVTYLESSLHSSSWNCPICDGAVFVHDLRLDRTLQSALDGLGAEVDTVVLFGSGHREWRAACQRKEGSVGATDNRNSCGNKSTTRGAQRLGGEGQQMRPQLCVVDDSEEEGASGGDAEGVGVPVMDGDRKRARYEKA